LTGLCHDDALEKFKGSIGDAIGDETGETSVLSECKLSGVDTCDLGTEYSKAVSLCGDASLISSTAFGASASTFNAGIFTPRSIRSCGFVLRFSGSISESDSVEEKKKFHKFLLNFKDIFF
jgi:hypothetical protein